MHNKLKHPYTNFTFTDASGSGAGTKTDNTAKCWGCLQKINPQKAYKALSFNYQIMFIQTHDVGISYIMH